MPRIVTVKIDLQMFDMTVKAISVVVFPLVIHTEHNTYEAESSITEIIIIEIIIIERTAWP